MFVFQQDSAPAHRARETVQLLQQQTPEFISPDLWPPNSPDLNPVDQEDVYELDFFTPHVRNRPCGMEISLHRYTKLQNRKNNKRYSVEFVVMSK